MRIGLLIHNRNSDDNPLELGYPIFNQTHMGSVLWTLVVRCFRMGLYYPNSSGLSQVVSWEIVFNNQVNPGRHFRFWALLGEIILSRSVKYSDLWCSRSRYDRQRSHGNFTGIQAEALRSRGLRWAIRWSWFSPGESPSDDQINGLFGGGIVPVLGLKQHKMTPAVSEKRHHWWIPGADISTMIPSDDWYERTWTVLLCLDRWLRNIVTFQ